MTEQRADSAALVEGAEARQPQGMAALHERRPSCDHICLSDADHLDRGERHFYGYELPSPRDPRSHLRVLASQMRANSERWFPRWHSDDLGMPLRVAYALGLAGEVGEVANVVKKLQRDGETPEQLRNLGAELADVFTYLLLLADECGIDLVSQYEAKVVVNEARWGRPTSPPAATQGGTRPSDGSVS